VRWWQYLGMSPTHTFLLAVKGMSCQHCVRAVTQAVQTLDPHAVVSIDLPSGQVSVTSHVDRTAVVQAIQNEGYEVAA
jgi:copper chaperone